MLSKILALTCVASAAAQSLSIVRPGPDSWWVASSLNTLQWSPCDTSMQSSIPAFNVVIQNSNQQVLAGNLTILGNEMTFECSKDITPNLPVATGYTMYLTNAINTLQVYASANFEVKAQGSAYPASSTSASASSTAASGSPSASSSSGKNAAGALAINLEGLFGAVAGAIGAVGALL